MRILQEKKEQLQNLSESYAFRQPLNLINQYAQRVDELLRQLQNYIKNCVREKEQTFRNWVGRLEALSPLAILERGYSLTFDAEGGLVKDVRKLKVGERIETKLHRGSVHSKIEKIEKNDLKEK